MTEIQEPQETRKPNRFRTIGRIGIAVAIALMFMFTGSFSIIGHVSASYPIGPIQASVTFGTPETVINTTTFNGPANSMTQTSGGEYLGFVREGLSHVNKTDYGVMKLYNSADGHTWTFNDTIVAISNRDIRNYAAGTTQTGRIIVFFNVYDVDNSTWGNTSLRYIYSDDDGDSWSAIQILPLPTIDGFTPTDGTAHGEVKVMGGNRVGMTIYAGNGSGTHLRLVYSDDDGATWQQTDISDYYPLPNIIAEGDIAYVGDNRLVVMARIDNLAFSPMFTSIDNGATWTWRGNISNGGTGARPATLSSFTDLVGQVWVLAIFMYGGTDYTYGYADSLITRGIDGWAGLIHHDSPPGMTSMMYATTVFDSSGNGLILLNDQITLGIPSLDGLSNVVVCDITAVNILSTTQQTIVTFINVIGILFVIGIIAPIALEATKPLKNQKKITVEYLIHMFIFIIVGMAFIGIYYSMFT
jgi:hypothetical protein